LKGIGDRTRVRKSTVNARVQACIDLVNAEPEEPWVLWGGLNDETDSLAAAIPDSVHVYGSQSPDLKIHYLMRFVDGGARVLITKPKIAGHGLNLQHCARVIFVGLGDSWEQYFQCIRRCWRFGQKRPVKVYVVLSDMETEIYENVLRKEREHYEVSSSVMREVATFEAEELGGLRGRDVYQPKERMELPVWL
jgi:superfamily II DNA or RNA helicase